MSTPTDTELNLAMCEWMGWKRESHMWKSPFQNPDWPAMTMERELPDYLSDDSPRRLLNEAEARLTRDQRESFENKLRHVVYGGMVLPEYDFKLISSTARDRVIAILQTVKPELFQ